MTELEAKIKWVHIRLLLYILNISYRWIDTLRDLLREKATVEANLTFVHQDLEVQKIYVEEVAISEKEHERDMEVIKQRYLTKVGELEDTTRQVIW